ncbi:MAG TPA: translation initiation factor IF-2, partial [Methyloceanibacter sp.]
KKQITGPLAQQKIQREVVVPEVITIQELANRMAERGVDVIKFLMKDGEMHKITDVIDADTAQLVAEEFGHTVRRVSEADVEEGFIGAEDHAEDLQTRAPIVTIMGHVDHGKTSLLDAIRTTNVVSQEAGGITQHIGAYQVVTPSGQRITFIDTPGHEAFTAMRARGAKVTDIVVLVVAADDGVKPQTVEAINHAKAAGVPIIVAINKIDKQGADPQRVRTELLSHEIVVESLGGDTLEIEVSALKKTGLDKLLEAIALQAEVLELRANPERDAEGVIVEAKLERGRGPVGTALIQRGTLHVGDLVVAGSAYGRVRALINELGEQVTSAGPSVPVEVLGFDSAPEAGDQFAVVENEARAREITDYRVRERRKRLAVAGARGSLEQMMTNLKAAGIKEFTLLVKGDVQGSVEAIVAALDKMGTDEVRARIVHAGVGGITESDVGLAATSGAVVLGFNVRANTQAREAAERDGVEIRYYAVIYDLVDEVKQAMSGMLAPTRHETFLGNAEILEVFTISKVGKVAGCRVTEGKVERGAQVRLIRDNVVVHEGKLSTLKRFKDEVREVTAGQECGMAFEGYQDMRPADVIECFEVEHVQRTL